MRKSLLLPAVVVAASLSAQQTDTIHAGDGQLDLRYLPAGTQRYLVYLKTNDTKKNIWLWERTTAREKWHDSDAIVVRQHWITSDTGFNHRKLVSVVDPLTFTPLYHGTETTKGGEWFNMRSREFAAADPVAQKKYVKGAYYPLVTSFNWELDLETFALLPLQEGKTFVINFVHPGSMPAWHTYIVTGSEKISAVNGEMIDCFKLYTEYEHNNTKGNSTWWLSKKTHEVLKMEEHFGMVTRYKIRLAVEE